MMQNEFADYLRKLGKSENTIKTYCHKIKESAIEKVKENNFLSFYCAVSVSFAGICYHISRSFFSRTCNSRCKNKKFRRYLIC